MVLDTGGQAYQAERQRIFPFEGGRGKSEEVIRALSQLEFGPHILQEGTSTVSEKGDDAYQLICTSSVVLNQKKQSLKEKRLLGYSTSLNIRGTSELECGVQFQHI